MKQKTIIITITTFQGIEPFSITQAYKFRLIERPTANDTYDGPGVSAGHAAVAGKSAGSTITVSANITPYHSHYTTQTYFYRIR